MYRTCDGSSVGVFSSILQFDCILLCCAHFCLTNLDLHFSSPRPAASDFFNKKISRQGAYKQGIQYGFNSTQETTKIRTIHHVQHLKRDPHCVTSASIHQRLKLRGSLSALSAEHIPFTHLSRLKVRTKKFAHSVLHSFINVTSINSRLHSSLT